MVALLLLLLVFCPPIQTIDNILGSSVIVFESEGARSTIYLQRSEHGIQGLKYLNVSIEQSVDDVPYQSILGGQVLTPENGPYIFDLHDQSEDLNFLVNFIDPCCGDKWVASIEYDEYQDTIVISYESCNQSVIPYESIVDSNVCYSTTLQMGSHCSLFCTCGSLPLDGKCPSPDMAPMIECNDFDHSFDTCDYDPQPSITHKMSFHWQYSMGIGEGTITSRVIENERVVAFNLINDQFQLMEIELYRVFGSKIDSSTEFNIMFDESFVLTMKVGFTNLALRFDVSTEGEVSIFYKNCEQFKMSEKGECYGGLDNGLFYFCEEDGVKESEHAYKGCFNPTPLTKNAELKVFFVDSHLSTEVGNFEMSQTSDKPGILHMKYTRVMFSSFVYVFINDQLVSYALETDAIRGDDPNEITIKIREIAYDSVEGHVEILFTDDGRIMTEVNGCYQFEIYSDQDPIQCRSQSSDQDSFCFCNRIQADQSNCLLPKSPILTCTTYDPRTHSTNDPEIFQQFAVTIFAGPQQAEYKISWEWEKTMGAFLFIKEMEYVNIDGADEFHTLDVLNGLIRENRFAVSYGDRVTISLPQGLGELFVMHFVPQSSGIELFYRDCSIGVISLTTPEHLPCLIDSTGGWNYSICPGAPTENPQQFRTCSPPMNPQVLNFDLIADLDSAYLYVGTARMDLQVYWSEDRPDYFNFNIKDYRRFGDVQLLINNKEYFGSQGAVFGIGTMIPIDYMINGKQIFGILLDLNSPIVSVVANDCEQFKLSENICRGLRTIFYSLKFCGTSDWISHNLLTCSDKTDPPIVIPSDTPHETYKMHFSYSMNSRSLKGFVTEEAKEDEGEILERSLVFSWIDDAIDDPSPFPFFVSFTTIGKTIEQTTPLYAYPIPFEVDSPVIFRVLDSSLKTPLFEFSIIIGEKTSRVIYEECDQFSIGEPDGICYGIAENYLCSGEKGDDKPLLPFLTCNPTDEPPLTDWRAFFIYQDGQKLFTWDVMMSKDNETGGWIVEATETGSTEMQGAVVRGNSAVSTLTFTVSVGETTVFSVVERQSGKTLDSFTILPSSQSVAVLYKDCTQFTMGEMDTIQCFYQIDTKICNGEPTKETIDNPVNVCNFMRFSLNDNNYGLVSQRKSEKRSQDQSSTYLQDITIIPPKTSTFPLKITVNGDRSDSYHFTLDVLQMITIELAPVQTFSLLALDVSTTVLSDSYCRQFEMEQVENLGACYSDGGVKLCPTQDSWITTSFAKCTYYEFVFNAYDLPGVGNLHITHFSPFYPPKSYSLLYGDWSLSESEFQAHIGEKSMKNLTHYALQPDGFAYFSYPYIPSSSFSIQLENGLNTAVLHEECFQFFMEDQDGQCFEDAKTSLCESQGGSNTNDYKECHSSSPSPHHVVISTETNQPMEMTTVEEERTTAEEEWSTTVSPIEGKTTTVEDEKITTTEKNEEEERSTSSSPVTEGEGTTTSMEWTTETTIHTTKTTTVTIPTIPTKPMTTISPSNIFYASIVLEEVTIGIEKNIDESTKDCKIVFEVKAVFSSRPSYKIYIDTIEYPYGTPFQVVRHNVGEVLNVTIAGGTEKMMCVELEIHTTNCTVLELDDCPQFTLEENVNECRSSDLICLCASSASSCPVQEDPLKTCKTTSLLPSSSLTPTTEGTPILSTSTSSLSTKMTTPPKKSLDDLSDLANTTITIDNVSQVLEETNEIVGVGSQRMEGQHIFYVSQILFNSANVTGISESDALLVLDTLDDTLGAPEQSFQDSSDNHDQAPQKFLQALPLLVVNSPSEKLFLNGKQLGFSSQKHACIDEQESSVFGLADTDDGFVEYGDVNDGNQPKSSIEIPTEAVCGSSGTHSFFSIHRTTKLFLGGMNYRKLAVKSSWFGSSDSEYQQSSQSSALLYSNLAVEDDDDVTEEEALPEACSSQQSLLADQPVLTATVLDASDGEMKFISRDEKNGGKMATITIDLTDFLRPLHGGLSFSWWDESSLQWSSSDHCQLREGQWGGKVIADCFHLTDFTLIVDGTVNDPCVCDTGLIIVGYVISAISICSLFLVVLATAINRIPSISRMKAFSFIREDLFRNRFHSVDILYTISLLFFYLIFTFFHDSSVAGHSCVVFSVISYSLLFCTILLTLFQSFRTIATFSPYPIIRRVLSFASHQIFVCTVSAGAPFLISTILAIVSNFFDRDDGFCWVRPDYITFAVVVPLSVLIVNGIICTILVVIRLYQEQKSQLMSGKNHLKRRIISVLIMQFTLGMPWILQYFTLYAPTSTVFHYLFTIVNGSQGIVLLLLYIYRRERRMTSMRRRRGAAMVARGVQAREMGAKHRSEDDEYYDDELDGKSTDGIVDK